MFRNDAQTGAACQLLLEAAGLRGYFDDARPTERVLDISRLSSGEQVLVSLAMALWNGGLRGGRPVPLYAILMLDNENLARVGSLLVAYANEPEHVDEWILMWTRAKLAVVR